MAPAISVLYQLPIVLIALVEITGKSDPTHAEPVHQDIMEILLLLSALSVL